MSANRQIVASKLSSGNRALDLDWREVDARHRVAPRQPSRDRNAAAAAEVEDGRTWVDPLLQDVEPVRVWAILRVVGSIRPRHEVVSAPHDRLRVVHSACS
jgi:hypothetical protein